MELVAIISKSRIDRLGDGVAGFVMCFQGSTNLIPANIGAVFLPPKGKKAKKHEKTPPA